MANPSKGKGTAMETWTVRYLSWALQDTRIDRMSLHGAQDRGDLTGVAYRGEPVCVEVKDTRKPAYAAHWRELETEMGNMDARYGVLVQHRPGVPVRSLEGMAGQMAVLSRTMLGQFIEPLEPGMRLVVAAVAQPIASCADLVWLPLGVFALVLNDMLPLGPEGSGDA